MNLAFHHFKKEARCISGRWCFWLGLLGMDLVVQLEWLLPMQTFEQDRSLSWWLHAAVLSSALLLSLVGCGEDQPSNDAAFIATRPLPRRSYFLGRLLLVGLLFMLPLALQEAVYLALSGRPLGITLADSGWSLAVSGAWLMWAVPGAGLWKSWWQALLGFAVVAAGLWICEEVVKAQADRGWLQQAGAFSEEGWVATAWLGIAIWALLAWRHQQQGLPLTRRLGLVAALSPVFYATLLGWELMVPNETAQDRAKVATLEESVEITLPREKLRPLLKSTYQGRPAISFYGDIRPRNLPPQMEMQLDLQKVEATLDGKPVPAHISHDDTQPRESISQHLSAEGMANALPAGTLMTPPRPGSYTSGGDLEYSLGRVETGTADPASGPLVLQSHFESTWYEWSTLADLPLEVGARAADDDVELTISHVLPDTASWVQAKPGSEPGTLTLNCRIHQREVDAGLRLVLHCPERKQAWGLGGHVIDESTYGQPRRAAHTGWLRSYGRFSEEGVLRYRDGQPAADVSKLRLIVMKRRCLGRSTWTWQSAPLDLRKHVPGARDWYYPAASWTPGDAKKQLERRLASLTAPAPEAPREVLLDYLLAVLRSYHTLRTDKDQGAQYDMVVEKLRPFAQAHLDLLLELPAEAVAGPMSPVFRLANQLCNENHRDRVVARILEADWMAALVTAKGWSETARERMLPAVMAVPRHEKHLRKLMLAWKDPAVQQRQIQELFFFPDLETFETLYAVPGLRRQLDAVATTLEAEIEPVKGWGKAMQPRLDIAIAHGSSASLDMALLWLDSLSQDDSMGDGTALMPFARNLAPRLGLTLSPGNALETSRQFRGLRAADFEYQPAQRTWRKKP